MPEHMMNMSQKDKEALERLCRELGYTDPQVLANDILKAILKQRPKVIRPSLCNRLVEFLRGKA